MIDDIRIKCIDELANVHGRQISRRFATMLENRENATGMSLSDVEVQNLKVRFNDEIYRELIGKGGK